MEEAVEDYKDRRVWGSMLRAFVPFGYKRQKEN